MSTTTLQVPVDADIKSKATKAARDMGFSSLQETVRVFLSKLAHGRIRLSLDSVDVDEYVSPKALARYDKMVKDIESGKVKTTTAHSVNELMEQLNAGV